MSRIVVFLPDGSQQVEDDRTLDQARAQAVARAQDRYEADIAAGVPFRGSVLQVDEKSVANITAMMLRVVAGIPLRPGFVWRMADNSFLPLDAAGVAELATVAANYVEGLLAAKWIAADAARAAETIEAADAIAVVPAAE